MTTFNLNGDSVTVEGEHPHLLSALREELNILSPKDLHAREESTTE